MTRKLFLLFAASAFTCTSFAQMVNPSIVETVNYDNKGLRRTGNAPVFNKNAHASSTANKGTGATSRTYNYVDYLALSNSNIFDNTVSPPDYFWFNYDMFGVYQGASALERDTIKLTSCGAVMHPFFAGFNDINAYGPGKMEITSGNPYKVDSVYAYGIYGRNPAKQGIVDTLRFALVYGDNTATSSLKRYIYTGMTTRYGVDTVRAYIPIYNAVTHTLDKETGSTGGNVLTRDILLRAGDTSTSVFKAFGIAPGMDVPAGNVVAVSVTFKSGETYTPFSDTAFRGSVNPTVPYKYGMWRPMFVNEDATAFPTYTPGNYNVGQFRTLPESATQPGKYSATWAWTTNSGSSPSDFQFPYMDFRLSCPSCKSLAVSNVSNLFVGNAFPNPANNTVSLPITMKQAANVNVSLSNLVGQVLATQNMGQLSANTTKNATFSTSGMANGVYFITAEANGLRTTSRFVVAH